MVTMIQPQTQIDDATRAMLRTKLRGALIEPTDPGYDDARTLYNAMHDQRPLFIVQPADIDDVIATVNAAREGGWPLAIKGGGHNVAGLGSVDNGIMLDLSSMRWTRVDPKAQIVSAGGGATWGEVDHATHAFGLATPSGIISTTGIGGLTLGGGFGHLTRRYGLTCDNLLSADVVTADGRFVKASATENPELFWALRGGGGNFGVVTAMDFRLHPVDTVYGGPIFYPADASADVLQFFRDFMRDAPRELSAFFGYHEAPPAPFVPEHLHGHVACAIVTCWTGPLEDAERAVKPIRDAAPVGLDLLGPIPYPVLNSMFDALVPPGLHHYWKADFVQKISDEAIAVHHEFGPQVKNFHSLMHLYPLDGAVHDVEPDATAFRHRDANFTHIIAGVDPHPDAMPAHTQWVRDYWSALRPHSIDGAYVNFLMDEGQNRVRSSYGANFGRLVEVKRTWDPGNLFRVNQNIDPS
jgi:FAD/FMN-containing dehydrogenase